MYVFINNIDKTSNVINNSIKIIDELQERINSASFSVAGFSPSYFEDVKIYEGFPIISASANTVTLKKSYNTFIQNNLFRIGDTIVIAIGLSDEENGIISSISNDLGNVKLIFTENFDNIPVKDELAGKKIFAGNIIGIKDKNQKVLGNISFSIKCLDYTRIFDKSNINDTYKNKDARYIINDFCNITVNNNQVVDSIDYSTTAELRTSWIESLDGNNPELDTSDFRETTGSAIFDWTNSGGTATFTNNFPAINISEFTGISSGLPIKGLMGLWYKPTSFSLITNIQVKIGNDSNNYGSFNFLPTTNSWVFLDSKLEELSIVGTPDWTLISYIEIIITQTGDSSIRFDGIRILEQEFFRHYPYVEESVDFGIFRAARLKPTETMQKIADSLAWYWYVDYDRNIRLFPEATNFSPICVNEESDNFIDLSIDIDTSRLINRQVVRGGNETSEDTYSQVIEGDGIIREWILKNKFKNLIVKLNNGSITDVMEGLTTTTNINATSHGLSIGDYIVNTSRNNAVREVLTVPDTDNFTVEAVTGQTTGDIFSLFVIQEVGIEGLDFETSFDFMSNFNEKSIRNSEVEETLSSGEFLLFTYNEVFPILVQITNNSSIESIKNILGYSDGIFDGQPITDTSINSRSEASDTASAQVNKYSNPVITAKFTTNQEGLISGQLIDIKDTDSSERNINQSFLIQTIRSRQIAWGENEYTITCSSLLYGFLELLQQLLAQNRKIKVDEDEVINNIEGAIESVKITDTEETTVGGEIQIDSTTISDIIETKIIEPPFKRGPILEAGDLQLEDGTDFLLEDDSTAEIDTVGGFPFIRNLSSWS